MKSDILEKITEAKKQEQQEAWNNMTTEQKRVVIKLQGALNRMALDYVRSNAKCSVCSGPAYKATKVAGESVTVVACQACKYVQSLNTLDG